MSRSWNLRHTLTIGLIAACVLGLWLRMGGDRGELRISGWGAHSAGAAAALAAPLSEPLSRALNAPLKADAGTSGQGLTGLALQQGRGQPADPRPYGNPLQAPNTVMTQGYGVGTHAPAEIWGAIDLAIDGNGDGTADPAGSWNHPIYATHSGVVTATPDSDPAGNHVWVTNDQYRTGYAHLARFAVSTGQTVNRGDLIGFLGSTGMSSGPHLDYQIWVKEDGTWVNVNPLDFAPLE